MSLFPFPWKDFKEEGDFSWDSWWNERERKKGSPAERDRLVVVRLGQEMGDAGSFSANSRELYLHTKNPDTMITTQKMCIC